MGPSPVVSWLPHLPIWFSSSIPCNGTNLFAIKQYFLSPVFCPPRSFAFLEWLYQPGKEKNKMRNVTHNLISFCTQILIFFFPEKRFSRKIPLSFLLLRKSPEKKRSEKQMVFVCLNHFLLPLFSPVLIIFTYFSWPQFLCLLCVCVERRTVKVWMMETNKQRSKATGEWRETKRGWEDVWLFGLENE